MKLSSCCGAEAYFETDLCNSCKEHADFYEDSEAESEELISEMEGIFLTDGWRDSIQLSSRLAEINQRLSVLLDPNYCGE